MIIILHNVVFLALSLASLLFCIFLICPCWDLHLAFRSFGVFFIRPLVHLISIS